MILLFFLLIPLVAGPLAWALGQRSPRWARWLALAALVIDLALIVAVWLGAADRAVVVPEQPWLVEFDAPWIPQTGIRFHLALDGLSLLLVALTALLGIVAVAASWSEISEQAGFFHFNLLWVIAGISGVFLAIDMFLFFFCWEMMLVPMYFLIAIWGHENRRYASLKFFLFTQLSGLVMLLAILGLYFVHGKATGIYTFDYPQWLSAAQRGNLGGAVERGHLARMASGSLGTLFMLGFFVAFAVKLPAVPLHTWLPDAHTEAPTAGSVILAGLMLKTGAYGLLRFLIPLFPAAAAQFAPVAMVLAVAGILYGAMLAYAQTDLKRLVAYTSVSHMGFVLLGAFAGNRLAMQGVMLQILCHGLSTGALFILVGALQERLHTRDVRQLGGLWSQAPRMGATAMFFAMASLGLPGLGNFLAEFLVLQGTYQVSPVMAVVASLGLIVAMAYSLWLVQVVFHGPKRPEIVPSDLNRREMAILGVMMAALVWLGLYPQPVLDTFAPVLESLKSVTSGGGATGATGCLPASGMTSAMWGTVPVFVRRKRDCPGEVKTRPKTRIRWIPIRCRVRRGGPDSSAIGAAKPQEAFRTTAKTSCACGTPIAELSVPPSEGWSWHAVVARSTAGPESGDISPHLNAGNEG